MADMFVHQEDQSANSSLQALLANIDREMASVTAQDATFAKEKAVRAIRRKKPHVVFVVGTNEMALSIDSIQEVGVLPPVTHLPYLPSWIKGITQIRGDIFSVVDFKILFELEGKPPALHWSYVLFKQGDFKFCLLVQRIVGVINIGEEHDTLTPYNRENGDTLERIAPFFKGLLSQDKQIIYILNAEQLATSSLLRKWQQKQRVF